MPDRKVRGAGDSLPFKDTIVDDEARPVLLVEGLLVVVWESLAVAEVILDLSNDVVFVLGFRELAAVVVVGDEFDGFHCSHVRSEECEGILFRGVVVMARETRHCICVGVLPSLAVHDFKVVEVELNGPPDATPSGVGFGVELTDVEQGPVIRDDEELPLSQIMGVCSDGREDSEEFLVVGGVAQLGAAELFGAVGHHLLFSVVELRENESNAVAGGISLDPEG